MRDFSAKILSGSRQDLGQILVSGTGEKRPKTALVFHRLRQELRRFIAVSGRIRRHSGVRNDRPGKFKQAL